MTVAVADDVAPQVGPWLALAGHHAEQELVPTAWARLAVERAGPGYRILDNGDELTVVPTPRAVLDAVFARIHRRAFELASLAGWLRVHGAVMSIGGCRMALIGPSGAGKTTLALQALAAGHAVEGDESFLCRDGQVVTVPRRFHVKPGASARVPAARAWLADAPVLDGDPPLRLLDPTEAGHPWRLPVAPLDRLVIIERGPGPSHRHPVPTAAALPAIVAQAFPTVEPRATVVRQAAGLLQAGPAQGLAVGDDGAALACLEVIAGSEVTG